MPDSAYEDQPANMPGRRRVLAAFGAVSAGLLVACTPRSSADSQAVSTSEATAATAASKKRTRVVLLGTAGGPSLFRTQETCGISTAVVYGDRVYIVDLGAGSFGNLNRSGLAGESAPAAGGVLNNVRAIFFTHMHSDHTVDWPTVYATGPENTTGRTGPPIEVFGPGPRTALGQISPPSRPTPDAVNPDLPGGGIKAMTAYLRQAFAMDFNDRIRDTNMADPASRFKLNEIDLTGIWDVDSAGIPPRLTQPIDVWVDGDVTVTATLVDHHPTAPAFAFRFDTPDGSIVVSGDTTVSENLIDLAHGTDCLVHEAIDTEFVDQVVAQLPSEIAEATRSHLLQSHTTIEQVGRDVAQPAGVKTLVLTHLAPPTGPAARWAGAAEGFDGELIVGTDLMQIGIGERNR